MSKNARRFDILMRDNFTCQYCGKGAPEVILEVDHIVPASKGGTARDDNLVTACFACNRGKRDKPLAKMPPAVEHLGETAIWLNREEMLREWWSLRVDLGTKDAAFAFGLYTIIRLFCAPNPYGEPKKPEKAEEMARLCGIDPRTARRFWPFIQSLLEPDE